MDVVGLVVDSEVDEVELGVGLVLVVVEGAVDVELPGEVVDSRQEVVDSVARGEHREVVEHPGAGEATKYSAALPILSLTLSPACPFERLKRATPSCPFVHCTLVPLFFHSSAATWQLITDRSE